MSNDRTLTSNSSNDEALIKALRDNAWEYQIPGELILQAANRIEQLAGNKSPSNETLYVGCPVTYSPLYPSQMPRDGWTIDRLPPELTHIIRHSSGSVIAVTACEIQPAQKAEVGDSFPEKRDV